MAVSIPQHLAQLDFALREVTERCKTEGRDATPLERTQIEASLSRISSTRQHTPKDTTMVNPNRMTHGEELLLRSRAAVGALGNPKFARFADEFALARTSGTVGELGRVLAHGTSADGTQPVTVEGALVNLVDANRYAVNASSRFDIPQNHSSTFIRPRVTQRTTAAIQTAQGDVLSSQALQLTGDTITKKTYGATLALSEQELDWTDPAMLDAATQDLARSYAIATDTVLTAAITAAATSHTVVSLTASAAVWAAGVSTAAAAVYAAAKRMPDVLFVAPDRWAYLTSLVDTTGRPIYPMGQAVNADGSSAGISFMGLNVQGLRVVVDPNFATNTAIVAASDLVEVYEQDKGLLSIAAPTSLETLVAYRGYFAVNVYPAGCEAITAS